MCTVRVQLVAGLAALLTQWPGMHCALGPGAPLGLLLLAAQVGVIVPTCGAEGLVPRAHLVATPAAGVTAVSRLTRHVAVGEALPEHPVVEELLLVTELHAMLGGHKGGFCLKLLVCDEGVKVAWLREGSGTTPHLDGVLTPPARAHVGETQPQRPLAQQALLRLPPRLPLLLLLLPRLPVQLLCLAGLRPHTLLLTELQRCLHKGSVLIG
mmetsp:Transcript_35089/g.78095  ORF Transcript_35089/g.78095 Transcript_35089/m.78095 type:complete len:211 (-) Transcript_35089:497-1129(-)